jgi:hypothetical protein
LPTLKGDAGKAAEQAAKMFKTNRKYVNDAKKIELAAPELLKDVRDGDLTIPEAKRVAELPLDTRQKAVERINQFPPLMNFGNVRF